MRFPLNNSLVLLLVAFSTVLISCDQSLETSTPNQYGLTLENDRIYFKVWSPDADGITLNIYEDCNGDKPEVLTLIQSDSGNWVLSLDMSYRNKVYTFTITRADSVHPEVVDPYVKMVCANGNRGYIEDVSQVNPQGWTDDQPIERAEKDPLLLYELHVRDFSSDTSAGSEFPEKYMAFTENRQYGISYIKNLGATHIHLLPVFDFASIDETLENPPYNWGYDPQNYFVPEGSFSTDPLNPKTRILEFKQMVQSIHGEGLGVIMDVVYNHTYYLDNSSFQVWAPGAYYRQWENGDYSNASACGNEIATEVPVVREMILESLKYWMREYHVDGFRFDLMGIMDVETMNLIDKELKKINPNVILYGEGWLAGDSPLPVASRAIKANMAQMPGIAAFSDEIRDGIKGHWSDEKDTGFVSGKRGMKPSVQFGITGGIEHPQIDYSKVNNSDFPWAANPRQLISYVSCHDNHTLWDKLEISSSLGEDQRRAMHLLAQTIVLTSQGIPFLHAGTEFFRTKFGDHNSFESPDSINRIRWHESSEHQEEIGYIRDLIEFRKQNEVFRLQTADEVRKRLRFNEFENPHVLAYELNAEGLEGSAEKIMFLFFPGGDDGKYVLPDGDWKVAFEGFQKRSNEHMSEYSFSANAPNAWILVQ